MYVRELRVSYVPRSDLPTVDGRKPLVPRDAAAFFREALEHEAVEVLGMLCLSTKMRVLCYHEVSRGTVDSTPAEPRDILRAAILSNAASFIVAHNHPSGDPTPSPDDRIMTVNLKRCGDLLHLHLLDSLVIGHDGRYFSFMEMTQL